MIIAVGRRLLGEGWYDCNDDDEEEANNKNNSSSSSAFPTMLDFQSNKQPTVPRSISVGPQYFLCAPTRMSYINISKHSGWNKPVGCGCRFVDLYSMGISLFLLPSFSCA